MIRHVCFTYDSGTVIVFTTLAFSDTNTSDAFAVASVSVLLDSYPSRVTVPIVAPVASATHSVAA